MPLLLAWILCLVVRVEYSSYAIAKLHVSVSRTTSRRAAHMRSVRSRSESPCRMWSFESGGERVEWTGNEAEVSGSERGVRLAMGRMQVLKKAGMDLLR